MSIQLRNGVQVLARNGIHIPSLRSKAENDPAEFVPFVREIAGLDPVTGAVRSRSEIERRGDAAPWRWTDVPSTRALRDALGADVTVQVPDANGQVRSVTTSAFALVAGALSVREVSEAYEGVESVMSDLVTDIDDVKKHTFVTNVLHHDNNVDEVKEGDDFPMLTAGGEKFSIGHKPNGRMISISQDLIEENDKPEIIARLAGLGEIAGELMEEQGLKRVTDYDGSASSPAAPYLLNLDGGKAFFQTVNTTLGRLPSTGNRITSNPLNDEQNLSTARKRIASMTNSRGKRIQFPRSEFVLLVPDALLEIALKLLGSEYVPGTVNELNPWGPRGEFSPKLVSTPKLDDLSATAWYYGVPRRVLRRKWKLRPEIVMLAGSGQLNYVNSREGFRVRVAWNMEVGAADYVG